MATATLSWVPGIGSTPPPPYGPDRQRICFWRGGKRQASYDVDQEPDASLYQTPALAAGEWTARVYSMFEAEYSQSYAVKSFIIPGTPRDPGSDTSVPSPTNANIHPPSELAVEVNE